MQENVSGPGRREVLVCAGLGMAGTVLAGCATYGQKTSAAISPGSPPGPSSTAKALTKVSEVPVGSGVIVGDTVVTQPAAGTFAGLSSVCPHAGCNVNKIVDGAIICPCHGSRFNLDGSVAKGPATEPLTTRSVVVEGDSIVLG
jgi:Rieske Fe-S protein